MKTNFPHLLAGTSALAISLAGAFGATSALADDDSFHGFRPGNLIVSRSVYETPASTIVAGVTQLPPNCLPANCVTATANAAYPTVFNNDAVDGSFGITSKIFLDQRRPSGEYIDTLEVPNSTQRHIGPNSDQMVTSFSSKSEIALNLSLDRRYVTFMGYFTQPNTIDVSNSNTPGVVDPTNPVPNAYSRVAATVDQFGHFTFTRSNAYSGNNGRAAILNDRNGANVFYTVGNAGNGSNPQPNGIIIGAGAQIMTHSHQPLIAQDPGQPTPVGSFNITQLGDKADKIGKDDNFRGLTVFNNVVYFTKGSGGNGINTVYFIDTSGFNASGQPLACPNGVGVPAANATLPTTPISYNASLLQTEGVVPYNVCVLKGFNTVTAKTSTNAFPFGIWFANATTLYVADEGNGTATYSAASGTYTAAAAQTTAGLQKWVFNSTTGSWQLAYTLTNGLSLGTPYTVSGYVTGNNAATGMPWAPATDGLRNLTGRVNHRDGTATIWAITSTVSGNGDQGADPNRLVMITDDLAATTLPAGESFTTVETAKSTEVLRGVSFTPGTDDDHREHAGDWDRGHDGWFGDAD